MTGTKWSWGEMTGPLCDPRLSLLWPQCLEYLPLSALHTFEALKADLKTQLFFVLIAPVPGSLPFSDAL